MQTHAFSITPAPGERRKRSVAAFRLTTLFLLAAMLQPLFGSGASAQEAPAAIPENVLQASVRIMTNVMVTPDDEDEEPFLCMIDDETILDWSVGSGTIITEDGYALTNHHVVEGDEIPSEVANFCEDQAPSGRATADWSLTAWLPDAKGAPTVPFLAEVVEDSSLRVDLAVVQLTEHLDGSEIDEPFPFVEFGDSDLLREPEKLFLVGYPLNAGDNRRVSEGIFSGWGDNGFGEQWIYTDATISGGNSGGTAINAAGLLVGIPTAMTSDDCRPGDTNGDGLIDEDDTGCIGSGGNYGILIPSNLAREFAEKAIGVELPVANQTPVEPTDETPTPDDPVEPSDGEQIGEIEFTAYGLDDETLDTYENVNWIDGCFENFAVQNGDEGVATWYLDDEEYLVTEFVWDEEWDPQACASIYVEKDEEVPYLDPGVYRLEVDINGQTQVSEDITVTLVSPVDDVQFRGKDVDGETIEADSDNVLTGEIVTLYADIDFTGMETDSTWQVEWYLDGELVDATEPRVWDGEADDSETARLRNADREPLEAGTYEMVLSIDDVVVNTVEVTIEN